MARLSCGRVAERGGSITLSEFVGGPESLPPADWSPGSKVLAFVARDWRLVYETREGGASPRKRGN